MTRCVTDRSQLVSYVTSELRPEEHRRLEAHLGGCADCGAYVNRLEETSNLLTEAPLRPEPPSELEEQVFARIRLDRVAALVEHAPLQPEPPTGLEHRAIRSALRAAPERRTRFDRINKVLVPALAACAVALAVFAFSSSNDAARLERERGEVESMVGPEGHDLQEVALAGPGLATTAELNHYRYDNYRLRIDTTGFPANEPGGHYEVLLGGDQGHVSAGSFRVGSGKHVTSSVHFGVDPVDYPKIEIVDESGSVVARGSLDPERSHFHD